jgi:hypothetical protein
MEPVPATYFQRNASSVKPRRIMVCVCRRVNATHPQDVDPTPGATWYVCRVDVYLNHIRRDIERLREHNKGTLHLTDGMVCSNASGKSRTILHDAVQKM